MLFTTARSPDSRQSDPQFQFPARPTPLRAFVISVRKTPRSIDVAGRITPCYDEFDTNARPEFLLDIINDIATIVGLARDVILLLLLTAALIAVLVIAKKVTDLLRTVKQTAEKAQDVLDTVSEKVVTPAASNPGALRALVSLLGFLFGRFRRSKD
jgi:hypothetical protein